MDKHADESTTGVAPWPDWIIEYIKVTVGDISTHTMLCRQETPDRCATEILESDRLECLRPSSVCCNPAKPEYVAAFVSDWWLVAVWPKAE